MFHLELENKSKLSIRVLGGVFTVWGIVQFKQFADFLHSPPYSLSIPFPQQLWFESKEIKALLAFFWLSLGFSAILLKPDLRRKGIALGLIQTIILIIGGLTFGAFYSSAPLIFILSNIFLLSFFNSESITRFFTLPYYLGPRHKRVFEFTMVLLLFGVVTIWSGLMFIFQPGNITDLSRENILAAHSRKTTAAPYIRSEFPLPYTLSLNKNFKIRPASCRVDEQTKYFEVNFDDGHRFYLSNRTLEEDAYAEWKENSGKLIYYPLSLYDFAKKLFTEKYSFFYFSSRMTMFAKWKGLKNYEIKNNGFDILISEGPTYIENRKSWGKHMLHFILFKDNKHYGGGFLYNDDIDYLRSIAASVKLNDLPFKTSKEYFAEGKRRYASKKYHGAKRMFEYVYIVDRYNFDTNLELGRVYIQLKDWGKAKWHLDNALLVRKDSREAANLIKKIPPQMPSPSI